MTIDTKKAVVLVRVPSDIAGREETERKMKDPYFNEVYHTSIFEAFESNGHGIGNNYNPASFPSLESRMSPTWRFIMAVHGYIFWPTIVVCVLLLCIVFAMSIIWLLGQCGVCGLSHASNKADKAPLSKHEEAMNVDVEPVVMHV